LRKEIEEAIEAIKITIAHLEGHSSAVALSLARRVELLKSAIVLLERVKALYGSDT
jgi:hypothetical protein